MDKNDLIIQKNAFELLDFGASHFRYPFSYWSKLFHSKDFQALLEGAPYNLPALKELILSARSSRTRVSSSSLLYLSHLLLAFKRETSFSNLELSVRLNPLLVFASEGGFHLRNDLSVIQDLCLSYQTKKDLHGKRDLAAIKAMRSFSPIEQLEHSERALQRLFSPSYLSSKKLSFDERLSLPFFAYGDTTFLFFLGKEELLIDPYFSYRYLANGNAAIFVFGPGKIEPSANHFFFLGAESLFYSSEGKDETQIPCRLLS